MSTDIQHKHSQMRFIQLVYVEDVSTNTLTGDILPGNLNIRQIWCVLQDKTLLNDSGGAQVLVQALLFVTQFLMRCSQRFGHLVQFDLISDSKANFSLIERLGNIIGYTQFETFDFKRLIVYAGNKNNGNIFAISVLL